MPTGGPPFKAADALAGPRRPGHRRAARVLGGCGFYADDLRIQVMPAAGHLLAEECPQPVAAAVRAFLQ